MFRGDLFVTIAGIHTLSLDVCVCQHKKKRLFFYYYLFDYLDFIEMAKNIILYQDSAVIINKVNLTQKLTLNYMSSVNQVK